MFKITDTLPEILDDLKGEWIRAVNDKKHPFRYVVISTQGDEVMSRYVVLRKVENDLDMIAYTDQRSRKVDHIRQHEQVQLLFYHARKGVQVMVLGRAELHHQDDFAKEHWQSVQGNGRRAYTTVLPPGEVIDRPEQGHEWMEELPDDYFTVIRIKPVSIEVLQLNRTEHLRARFHAEQNWKGEWLVP